MPEYDDTELGWLEGLDSCTTQERREEMTTDPTDLPAEKVAALAEALREARRTTRRSPAYAYRATKPADLWLADDPIGPENDEWLTRTLVAAHDAAQPVIAAWGTNAKPDRVAEVLAFPAAWMLHALAVSKDGHPRHPLYLPKTARPLPWAPKELTRV